MPNTLHEKDWNRLLRRIKDGKCTPFLGAGVCAGVLPLGSHIAQSWAKQYDYPLDDDWDLVRVAQFLAVDQDPMFPKEELLKRFQSVRSPNFADPNEPHRVLADLPLPVYITTNYDDFMMQALEDRNRKPRRELCRWNKIVRSRLKNQPSIFKSTAGFDLVATPIVFHLHGHNELVESLVLTEDDYLDFLISISQDQDLLPPRIQEALAGTSLLFLGYRIADWDLRVLFRSLVSYLEKSIGRTHVSVQLEPGTNEAQKEKARKYLDRYFEKLDIRVYWGRCDEFAADLRARWEVFNCGD